MEDPLQINLKGKYWAFWQKSYAYDINEELTCLYDTTSHLLDEGGHIVHGYGESVFDGVFQLYKKFKMRNGRYGIDKLRPAAKIQLILPCREVSNNLDKFIELGIQGVYDNYKSKRHEGKMGF